jgi:tRNA(Glu) U13 pseudouridine synthase TruD
MIPMEEQEEPSSSLHHYKALIIRFDLASSQYATMALRELLKSDTSCSVQKEANQLGESKI